MRLIKKDSIKPAVKVATTVLAILCLIYFDFWKNANAEIKNDLTMLYMQNKYNDLIEVLNTKEVGEYGLEDHYLKAKAYLRTGNADQGRIHLAILEEQLPFFLRDIVLYEKLSFYRTSGELNELLVTITESLNNVSNPYLLDKIAEILVADYQTFADKQLLGQTLEALLPYAKTIQNGPELLRLYASTLDKNDLKVKEILVLIWQMDDINALSTSEREIEKTVKAGTSIYSNQIVEHFKNQRTYRNYRYMSETIPSFLNGIEDKSSKAFIELRELYFFSLIKNQRFSQLLGMLNQHKARLKLGLSDKEAYLTQFEVRLKKGDLAAALATLNRLSLLEPEQNLDSKYLMLADAYFERSQFEQALNFYNRLKLDDNRTFNTADVKWKMWRSYFQLGKQQELAALAEWARSFEFNDNEIAARFCYWGYKLNLYQTGSIDECFERFPLTFYGLHAHYGTNRKLAKLESTLPANSLITLIEEVPTEKRNYLQFLQLVYFIEEYELADSFVRIMLTTENSQMMLALAKVLLEAERYYLVQLIAESKFRSVLESSATGRNLLLSYFYPLAYDTTVSQNAIGHSLSKMLILSVMREESHFNPQVISIAGAVGLMQLMPKTAEYMAKRIGITVEIESLVDPELNLRLGSAYLKSLMNRYDGNLFYTLAAYNGGPSNVTRWLQKTKTKDDEDFIETITFKETQNYVRRVMRSYYLYRYLYE